MMNYIGAGIQPLYKCQQTSGYVRFAGGAPSQRGADNICSELGISSALKATAPEFQYQPRQQQQPVNVTIAAEGSSFFRLGRRSMHVPAMSSSNINGFRSPANISSTLDVQQHHGNSSCVTSGRGESVNGRGNQAAAHNDIANNSGYVSHPWWAPWNGVVSNNSNGVALKQFGSWGPALANLPSSPALTASGADAVGDDGGSGGGVPRSTNAGQLSGENQDAGHDSMYRQQQNIQHVGHHHHQHQQQPTIYFYPVPAAAFAQQQPNHQGGFVPLACTPSPDGSGYVFRPIDPADPSMVSSFMAAASMTSNPGVEDNQRVNIANQEFLSLTAMTGTVQDFGRSSTENSSHQQHPLTGQEGRLFPPTNGDGTRAAFPDVSSSAQLPSSIFNDSSERNNRSKQQGIKRTGCQQTRDHVSSANDAGEEGEHASRVFNKFQEAGDGSEEMRLEGTMVYITCHSLKALRNAIAPLVNISREEDVNMIFENARRRIYRNQQVTWAVIFKTRRQARAVVRYLGGQGHDARLADEPELAYTNIYVANLPPTITQHDVERLVSKFGTLTSVKMLKDSDGKGLGVAFANLSTPGEAVNAIRGIHNQKFDDWDTVPYARLAYRYGKSAHIARLLRIVSNNVSPAARSAALRGRISRHMFNGEYGLYWNPPQLALMSLCQLYRMAERREDQNRARMRMANGPDGVGVGRNAGRRDREYGADYDDEEDDEDSLSDDGLYLNSLGRVSNGWSKTTEERRSASRLRGPSSGRRRAERRYDSRPRDGRTPAATPGDAQAVADASDSTTGAATATSSNEDSNRAATIQRMNPCPESGSQKNAGTRGTSGSASATADEIFASDVEQRGNVLPFLANSVSFNQKARAEAGMPTIGEQIQRENALRWSLLKRRHAQPPWSAPRTTTLGAASSRHASADDELVEARQQLQQQVGATTTVDRRATPDHSLNSERDSGVSSVSAAGAEDVSRCDATASAATRSAASSEKLQVAAKGAMNNAGKTTSLLTSSAGATHTRFPHTIVTQQPTQNQQNKQ